MIYVVDAGCVIFSAFAGAFTGRDSRTAYWGWLAVVSMLAVAWWALEGSRDGVALEAGSAVFAALMWWWRRRKDRKRALKALSRKYRHVRDAMVRTLRERRQSRPALAPGRA